MSAARIPNGIDGLAGLSDMRLGAKKQDPEALKAAARQFESMFTQMMLKSARAANTGDDLLGGGQTEFYQDMFDQQVAQQMSAGKGLGIADMLIRQLQHGGVTSTATPSPLLKTAAAPAKAAASAPANSRASFMEKILPHAKKVAAVLGVPAQVIAAQAALETGWGKHVMKNADGSSSFNLFGIKADKSWNGDSTRHGTDEYVGGVKQRQSAAFRSYGSIEEAFDDYASFLKSNPRYAQALASGDNFAHGLQKAGYATDPGYAHKIMSIAGGERMQVAMANLTDDGVGYA